MIQMKTIAIETPFDIGEKVFLITDEDQSERLVEKIIISPNGITYVLAQGLTSTEHYAMEISRERDIVKRTSE